VTYMFDDAETGFNNRDSLGNACEIRAGDNYWTVAGRGVLHDEVPVVNGKIAHGLQLFVNLGAGNKHIEPYAIHIAREDMPRFTQASGARVKVAFGGYDDGERAFAPVKPLPTDANLFDIEIPAAQSFQYAIAAGVNAFLLVIKGSVSIGGATVNAAHAVGFGRRGGALEVTAIEEAHIALFLGAPLNEPVVRHGPFAMTSRADIERAIAAYQSGQMGELR
jgi:redox-sensitive bicupin YhaK (pirin superfamily)